MTAPLRALSALLALLAAGMLATGARAQDAAPDGNAHPETNLVTNAGEVSNPFGEPSRARPPAAEDKLAFARALDLDPLRGLAVFHNGRVKILDTLAAETVERITGKGAYEDLMTVEGRDDALERARHDPLFTLLDLIIDPGYYVDKPLIHVEYLPLRRRMLEMAYEDQRTRQRFMRLTRVTPRVAIQSGQAIQQQGIIDEPTTTGLAKVNRALRLWDASMQNLMLIAPDSPEDQYHHLSELDPSHPARVAASELGEAWRALDTDAANSAIRTLAETLPTINADMYPQAKRSLELTYNRGNFFEWGLWAYFLSLLTLVLAFATGRRWLVAIGIGSLVLAVGLHATGFALRCVIAERFAIQNQFESMTGLSLFATLVGAGIMIARRQWLFGAAAAGVGFLVLITATQTGIPGVHIEREAAILNTSVLLKYHVTTVLVSYGLIALGFVISLFYLGTYYAGKLKAKAQADRAEVYAQPAGAPAEHAGAESLAATALGLDGDNATGRQRVLNDLDKALMTVLQLAFWTLGVGILLGAWWADHSWGRWWAFDPKETWALATWIIYLIVIHVRLATSRNRQLVTAWLSVLGFFVMLWTYFGVNLLLPGLHAYA